MFKNVLRSVFFCVLFFNTIHKAAELYPLFLDKKWIKGYEYTIRAVVAEEKEIEQVNTFNKAKALLCTIKIVHMKDEKIESIFKYEQTDASQIIIWDILSGKRITNPIVVRLFKKYFVKACIQDETLNDLIRSMHLFFEKGINEKCSNLVNNPTPIKWLPEKIVDYMVGGCRWEYKLSSFSKQKRSISKPWNAPYYRVHLNSNVCELKKIDPSQKANDISSSIMNYFIIPEIFWGQYTVKVDLNKKKCIVSHYYDLENFVEINIPAFWAKKLSNKGTGQPRKAEMRIMPSLEGLWVIFYNKYTRKSKWIFIS